MKVYKGSCASPGLVLGQVSRLEHHVETTTVGPFKPSRELQLLTDAIRTAQDELESMADRAAPSEQAIFQFQSMMLDDEGMMNEVRFCINAGVGAAAAMNQVGQRYADQLANMKDNPYMQLRSVDILDATRRVINILTNRPRVWLALDHPVILAADRLMPTDLFSVPSGMILGVITAEGSGQSHAAIIARAMNIPGIVQVGRDFLDDCDGRAVILDATGGQCTLDPDAAARQQAETRICELQRENEEMGQLHALPNRTKDGQPFELLANCFGPEDIDTAMQSGARGVGLLRSSYMMLPGRILDEQEQFYFYSSCLAAAQGCPVTVRTFDFGADRTMADAYQGVQSSKLGLRGIRNSLRQPRQFETQLCALMRAAARGPLQVMFPMVTTVEDWDAAMRVVERCREHLRERGVPFKEDTKFGVMLSVPAACLTAEEFVAHGVDFLVVGTNDLTQYTHAADRELASAEHYYRPASKAMKKLIRMVMDAAKQGNVPVTICGLAVGNPANTAQYLHLGLRSFSVSPQNLLKVKRALLDTDAHPDEDAAQKARHDGTDQIKQQLVLLFVDAFPIHPVDETGEDDRRRDIGQSAAEEDSEASCCQHRADVADPRRLRLRVLDGLYTGNDVLRRRAGGANFAGEGIQLFYPVEVGGIASGDAPGLDDLVAVRRACRDLNKGGNGKHTHLMHPIGVEDAGDGVLHPRHLAAC